MSSPSTAGAGGAGGAGGALAPIGFLAILGLTVITLFAAVLGSNSAADASAGACGGGGSAQTVGNVSLNAAQMGNVKIIVTTIAAMRGTDGKQLPAYTATVALATAMQESSLINSTEQTDHDSEGLFQQRVSIYTAAIAADPVKSTQAFVSRLLTVANWQSIPLTDAAADVQIPREDLRGRYAQWQPMATALTGQFWPAAAAANAPAPSASSASSSTPAPAKGNAPTATPSPTVSTVSVPPAACANDGGALATGPNGSTGGHGNNVAGSPSVPSGLVITGSTAAQGAVRFALAQLGKPYVFGAAGPDSFDCSGLTMAAWATQGVAISHYTAGPADSDWQLNRGTPEPTDLSQAVGGDLVFIPGSDGTVAEPGHVGMIIGYVDDAKGRHLYLVQAPMTGIPVIVTDTSEWAGQIVAVRHLG